MGRAQILGPGRIQGAKEWPINDAPVREIRPVVRTDRQTLFRWFHMAYEGVVLRGGEAIQIAILIFQIRRRIFGWVA